MRVFGSLCHQLLVDNSRGKLDPKTAFRVFVGYCPHRKGYKLLDPVTLKIKYSRSVFFNENVRFCDFWEVLSGGGLPGATGPLCIGLREDALRSQRVPVATDSTHLSSGAFVPSVLDT
jgi:hypothetical protein